MSDDPASAQGARVPPTERRHPGTVGIDEVPTVAALAMLHDDAKLVWEAVERQLPALAEVVDVTAARLRDGGRLHYFGAGTSGRLACLDAAELPPTFGVDPDLVVAHLAGGPGAMTAAIEGAEDDAAAGEADAAAVGPGDVVVGITASGRTPYVGGALRAAGRAGAVTVLVSGDPQAPLGADCDRHIALETGPEPISGSTRLKAGSAQKLLLNALSTLVMVRLGRTYSNLMVAVSPANAKLRARAVRLLAEASGAEPQRCAAALDDAGWDGRVALAMLLSGAGAAAAAEAVERQGSVGAAVAALAAPAASGASDGSGTPDGRGEGDG